MGGVAVDSIVVWGCTSKERALPDLPPRAASFHNRVFCEKSSVATGFHATSTECIFSFGDVLFRCIVLGTPLVASQPKMCPEHNTGPIQHPQKKEKTLATCYSCDLLGFQSGLRNLARRRYHCLGRYGFWALGVGVVSGEVVHSLTICP